MMDGLQFAHPIWLLGLLPVVYGAVRHVRAAIRWNLPLTVAPAETGREARPAARVAVSAAPGLFWSLPVLLRWFAIGLLVVGLARPRLPDAETKIYPKGIAIVLVVDTSLSMVVRDFRLGNTDLSRLDAVRRVARRFVVGEGEFRGRAADQIGVVSFANFPDVQCPLTLSHSAVLRALRRLRPSPVYEQGTNIGDALLAGLELLKGTQARSKVMILLSDGVNEPAPVVNAPPPIEPTEAAALAKSLGVKIYTVGTGTWSGRFWYRDPDTGRIHTPEAKPMDRALLTALAEQTGGRFWAAAELEDLERIWREIDRLEPSSLGAVIYRDYRELFPWFGWVALGLLVLERLLVLWRWRLLEGWPVHSHVRV